MRRISTLGTIAVLAFMSASAARALPGNQPQRPLAPAPMQQAGTLTCNLAPAMGLGFGSSRPATCIFDHFGANGFSEKYAARLSRVGFDVGFMGPQSIKLSVFTPDGLIDPGQLAGALQGMSAEAGAAKAAFQNASGSVELRPEGDSTMSISVNVGAGQSTLELDRPMML